MSLSLDQALSILAAARAAAKARSAKPLAYAVVDAGGHVLAQQREAAAGPLRNEIAGNKAWGCIALRISSGRLARTIEGHGNWWVGLSGAAQGRLIPSPGGVFIRSVEGTILGAIGISGEASKIDEEIAVEAIEAAGLVADTEGD
jgi:uncharacterized protein GlcG (DUF336 family)